MAKIIPDWVKEALNEKLARGDIGFASCGVYTVYVERHNECWCGRLDADCIPTWYCTLVNSPRHSSGTMEMLYQ